MITKESPGEPSVGEIDAKIEVWLKDLKGLYGQPKLSEFEREKSYLRAALGQLSIKLRPKYELVRPYRVGGTGVIFVLHHSDMPQEMVLKFNRPLIGADELSMVENE